MLLREKILTELLMVRLLTTIRLLQYKRRGRSHSRVNKVCIYEQKEPSLCDQLKGTPTALPMLCRSSITGAGSGIPSTLLFSSCSLSGSPGSRGPCVPFAGFDDRKILR